MLCGDSFIYPLNQCSQFPVKDFIQFISRKSFAGENGKGIYIFFLHQQVFDKMLLLIGAIVPICDRRNRATFGSPKSGQFVIGEMEPGGDRRNEATS